MQRTLAAIIAFSTVTALTTISSAQLVVVRPGYVKAPFVRVYTSPGGGSRVRAPFVDVGRPPVYGPGPIIGSPSIPYSSRPGYRADLPGYPRYSNGSANWAVVRLAELEWKALRNELRQRAIAFDRQLQSLPTGAVWRTHFKSQQLVEIVGIDRDAPPTAEEQAAVVDALGILDEAQQNADLNAIVRLQSFSSLREAIVEFLKPAELRSQALLDAAARGLQRALGDFDTASHWRAYLKLPATAKSETKDPAPEPEGQRLAQLTKTLAKFDAVSQSDEYRMISSLPEFNRTRRNLRAHLDVLSGDRGAPIEELPNPDADKP